MEPLANTGDRRGAEDEGIDDYDAVGVEVQFNKLA
jgi:hypothetical protein